MRLIRDLGIPADSSTNVQENGVEPNVKDRARLEATLHEAGLRLPNHAKVVEVEGLAEPATDTTSFSEELDGVAPGSEESFNSRLRTVPTAK
jgi:hypothetical protein